MVCMTTLQEVELRVLGPLQVRLGGLPVSIPGAKPRAVLTMLGLHGGSVVPADALAELLWGADPPRTAAKALQTHISALRRALGDGFVLTEGAGWTVRAAEIDTTRYHAAAKLGRDAAAAGDNSQAVARFDEALKLWRGIPELPDSPRGAAERTRWIESHAALVEDRADALLATGRAAEIVGELEAAVAEVPLRERRWGQLMLALYRAGRQGEALAAYQRARALLADELGVDPGPELRRLEAAIVTQDAALDIPASQHVPSVTRAVTFLLTDIEGSTAAWEADAAAMAVALARHDELAEQVVTSRGGRLIKTRGEGDATFSVFERPSAAAAAAIELQDAITREPWELSEPMRIRVALHTGEVELRDGDYFGRAVNRAARLRSLAAGGQILCSGATAELVIDTLADDVVLADLGVRPLKNLARPEHVFELRLDTAADDTAPPADDAPITRPNLPAVLAGPGPFVGRGAELAQLLSGWQSALSVGARAVLIAGEPGVGKTRLAGEWSRQAYAQAAVVLYGRCDEDLGAPYQPFAEALRSLVPCIGADRLRRLRGVEALLPLVPGLTEVVPDLAAPPRADPDTERYALFDAVVALLEVASASAPVVLILDDLHWAAKPTLLLLRHLLRFGERARVQILGTYRSTDLDRSHPLAAMLADLHRDGTADRIALSGLDANDVTAYVSEAGYDDEDLARALASVTGGNPFFLIEALRHVEESGGHWDPSTLPQGVREAVSRRLSRLPEETNKALAAAAVIGSRFAVDLVEQVLDQDLVDALDEAGKAGIIIEEPGGRYRFNHAIVRQSLLAELASVRRMRLHQRIATALETRPGTDDELLAELAHHYFECAWAGNAAKAVEYCRRAADQAMARLGYEGAADLYDRALHALDELDEELPDRDEQRAELLVARCEALLAAGDAVSASGAVTQLQQATPASERLAAWATCFDGQLSMLIHPERLDEVEVALGAAARTLAGLDDPAGEAKAHTVRAGCLARLGRIGDCESALDEALTAARRAQEHRRVNAVLAGAPLAALWGPNPVPRAGGRCLDVVRLLRITTDSPAVEAISTRCQAVLEAYRGRAAAARRMIDTARRTVTELGLRHALLEVEHFAGVVELVLDDPAAAEPHLRKAYNGFRRMGLDADTAETAALLARACLLLGRDRDADELCSESERLAGHGLKASIAWRTVRAQLLARRGDHDEARRVAEAAVAVAERTDGLVDHGDACLALATVLGAAGDPAGARTAAQRAVELYERKGAAALAEKARQVLGERIAPTVPAAPEAPAAELDALQARLARESPRRLENAASRAFQRFAAYFVARDWDALTELVAENVVGEDRRPVMGMGNHHGRDALIRQLQVAPDLGVTRVTSDTIASRGDRLILTHAGFSRSDETPEPFRVDLLYVVEINADERIAVLITFDPDDVDAAFAELDARYLAGEAAPHAHAWSVIAANYAALNRHEIPKTTPDWVNIDHRRATVIPAGEMTAVLHTSWEDTSDDVTYVETIHRLSDRGAVVTQVTNATSSVGFEAEWRMVILSTVDGELCDRCEAFDEADLDAALARFDELSGPARRLDNTANQVTERFMERFTARDWDAMAQMVIDDISFGDRRRVVNADLQVGRDLFIENFRIAADLGAAQTVSAIATRGDRLVLVRARFSRDDGQPEEFGLDLLHIVEIDADNRTAATVTFDPDDLDAAFAELDARYLAGEAAAHARVWSVVTAAYEGFNRQETAPMTPDCATIDNRRAVAFEPGDMTSYLRAAWEDSPDTKIYIEAVHRLSDLGVVVTHVARGTSQEGFEAEWRDIDVLTVDGDRFNRSELYDESDLNAALARFGELSRPAPHLENAASRVVKRGQASFEARDWDTLAAMLAENISNEDRRRVVGSGVRLGREAQRTDMQAVADLFPNVTSTVLATRGERLVLARTTFSDRGHGPEALITEALSLFEIDADERVAALVTFDPDDLDAAFAELDARYLAGEAAPYARVWQFALDGLDELNRHKPGPIIGRLAYADHRRVSFGSADFGRAVEQLWALVPDARYRVTAVCALEVHGTVVSIVIEGTDAYGSELEWPRIILLIPDDPRIEVYDESDLDAALAKFEELRNPAPRLENAATRMYERHNANFIARDWDAMADMVGEDLCTDDRRRVVNGGIHTGRDAHVANMRAIADVGVRNIDWSAIAIRGDRLALLWTRPSGGQSPEAFSIETLVVIEVDADGRSAAAVLFDLDDRDAAFAELDARYLAGEAAPYAQTWSVMAKASEAFNRHEQLPVTADWVNLDHRRGISFQPGHLMTAIRAGWEDSADLSMYIEAVHRLSRFGAVVTHVACGTTRDDFAAEWRGVDLYTVDGALINQFETYEESDLDAALARFEELQPRVPRLESTASRAHERFLAHFRDRNWVAIAEILTEGSVIDDRHDAVTSAGFWDGRDAVIANLQALAEAAPTTWAVIATRGERLALTRICSPNRDERNGNFSVEMLVIAEVDTDGRIAAQIAFDPDDIGAAFAELDARYLAGEAASFAHTWQVIAGIYAAMNRHEFPAMAPDWVTVDHRRLPTFSGDLTAYLGATWDLTPDIAAYIETVHRLSDRGAVITLFSRGTSQGGFAAEWRMTAVSTVEGDLVSRGEIFDESDLDAALVRFDEFSRAAPRPQIPPTPGD